MSSIKFTKKTLSLLFYLSALLVIAGCVSKPKQFGIIFTLNDMDGPIDIYRLPDNTQSQVEQLTFTPTVGEYGLLVSQNGAQIVFRTDHYPSLEMEPSDLAVEELRHVYHLDIDSQQLMDITNVVEDAFPQVGPDFFMDWSPTREQFMVVTHRGEGDEIESWLQFVDFDGENQKEILIPPTGALPSLIQTAKWSPDGKKLVLTQAVIGIEHQFENPGSAILIYDLETEKITPVTANQDHCLPVEWSPTSHQIVAICSNILDPLDDKASQSQVVHILSVENPGLADNQTDLSPCYDPSWSPDGEQIVLVCDKGSDRAGLFIANSDGSQLQEVKLGQLGDPAVLKNPTWAPDGTQIIYVAGSDHEHTNIYSVYPDGSGNHPLTNQSAFYTIVAVYPVP
ncbi:MAG TPA: hypothetical protein PLT26_16905 [Anaerolineaceae bacterium]|nr:hypothetical protein [Anaerolineaceae bacterium]